MADNELAVKLQRRNEINEGERAVEISSSTVFNPYTEFPEFSRKQIKHFEYLFKKFDVSKDKFIDFEEMKRLMEHIGAPQTHLALKAMIKEIDEDHDNKVNFREFLLIFRKAASGEFDSGSAFYEIYNNLSEIDVDKEGVTGAKGFFEAKIKEQAKANKFEAEIKEEQEEKKRLEEEKKQRRAEFKAKANLFKS
ncbi:DgyrCDS4688 [Dimorphilus gyrociliatus]|uniref:DgyrCDS4688 n=1 Tax=Dimorphilus gyrociliatus TaxID=2664684 RepID=A0A7I8VKD3_9ANNE|nr:DgyrCDS4688 [Dimorphilus gyrociliatus]